MNSLVTIQNVGTISWDGTAMTPTDIRKFVRFSWSFEVVTDIAVDAVFNIESAPPSEEDPCVPGAWSPVPEIAICDVPAEPGPQATVTIPAGTPAGTVCAGTIPCRPDAFVRLNPASGDTANVRAVIVRQGPMI